jgi:hypothetical protein
LTKNALPILFNREFTISFSISITSFFIVFVDKILK